jgi:hypothetical protein
MMDYNALTAFTNIRRLVFKMVLVDTAATSVSGESMANYTRAYV